MDAIREQIKNPVISGITGLVAGVLIGLVVLGWWLFPVEWTNADASHLRPDLQQDYLRMAIDSFAARQDVDLALERWNNLGEAASQSLAEIESAPGSQSLDSIAAFRTAVIADLEVPEAPQAGGAGGLLPVLCLVALLLGLAFGGVYLLRQRSLRDSGPVTAAEYAAHVSRGAERTDYSDNPPVGQFMTTYMLGDDLFDDSFSIDSPSGEFLGECGAGISETVGVGDPKRVAAFEVWLFDKNDIQTVTRVLMSEHSYEDSDTRQRLATKGEPYLAKPGEVIELETETLNMRARVVDMTYGEGPLPPDSYFDRITLELAVWQKEA